MTYSSLYVRAYPEGVTDQQLARAWTPSEAVWTPSVHSRDHGPGLLRRWAEEQSLTICALDPYWLRVRATPEQVRLFLEAELGEPAELGRPPPGTCYVIEAEEF